MKSKLAVAVVLALAAGVSTPAKSMPAHSLPAQPAWPKLTTAGPFLLNEIRLKARGRWGVAWQSLYPLDKLVATQAEYVRCEQATPLGHPANTIRVVRVRRSLFRVSGLVGPAWSAAVTVHVELQWYGPRDPIVLQHTFHLIPVNGHWTWLLAPDRYRLYLDDNCDGAVTA